MVDKARNETKGKRQSPSTTTILSEAMRAAVPLRMSKLTVLTIAPTLSASLRISFSAFCAYAACLPPTQPRVSSSISTHTPLYLRSATTSSDLRFCVAIRSIDLYVLGFFIYFMGSWNLLGVYLVFGIDFISWNIWCFLWAALCFLSFLSFFRIFSIPLFGQDRRTGCPFVYSQSGAGFIYRICFLFTFYFTFCILHLNFLLCLLFQHYIVSAAPLPDEMEVGSKSGKNTPTGIV